MITGFSSDRIFVILKDNFTKFCEEVPTAVNHQDQKDFSSGGTNGGNSASLNNFEHFGNQRQG